MTDAKADAEPESSHEQAVQAPPTHSGASSDMKMPEPPSKMSRASTKFMNMAIAVSDWAAGYGNAFTESAWLCFVGTDSEEIGGERTMPSTNDFPLECDKCTRILRAYWAGMI